MTPNHLAEQRTDAWKSYANDIYFRSEVHCRECGMFFNKGFSVAIPIAFAERDRMILEFLRKGLFTFKFDRATCKEIADRLEEELKKRDGK